MNYFEESIQTGQPIVPPQNFTAQTNPVVDISAPAPITPNSEFKGLPVRAAGDRIFILKGGKRAWVTSPEVYTRLGFKFGDEVRIDQATLDVLPEGEPLR